MRMKSNPCSKRNLSTAISTPSGPFRCMKRVKFHATKIALQLPRVCIQSARRLPAHQLRINPCLWWKRSRRELKLSHDAFKNFGSQCKTSRRKIHLCHAPSASALVSQNWLPFSPTAWLTMYWRTLCVNSIKTLAQFKPKAQTSNEPWWTARTRQTLRFTCSRFETAPTT